MSSAPPWKGLATQFIADGGNGPDGRFPALAFTTEAERDEAASVLTVQRIGELAREMLSDEGAEQLRVDLVERSPEITTLRTRLAEAERLMGVVTEDYYAERLRLGAPTGMPASIVTARRFLQGESKDG